MKWSNKKSCRKAWEGERQSFKMLIVPGWGKNKWGTNPRWGTQQRFLMSIRQKVESKIFFKRKEILGCQDLKQGCKGEEVREEKLDQEPLWTDPSASSQEKREPKKEQEALPENTWDKGWLWYTWTQGFSQDYFSTCPSLCNKGNNRGGKFWENDSQRLQENFPLSGITEISKT